MTAALLLLFLLLLTLIAAASAAPPDLFAADGAALLALKRAVTFDPAGLLSGWDPVYPGDHCHWRGVACDPSSGRVTAVAFTATPTSRLAGTLPPTLSDLSDLRSLSLPFNAFSGAIPTTLPHLNSLNTLNLRGNNFSGSIPGNIQTIPSLQLLDVSYNYLSGPIPEGLLGASSLESIDLSFNQLSGEIKISGSCKFLTNLDLSHNLLVNKIPAEIGKCGKLRTLLVNDNILEGRIPADVGRIHGLRVLDVSRNCLTDRIPRELGNCSLAVLVLTNLVSSVESGTSDEFNAFVGGVPVEVMTVPSLEMLWAPRANLEGSLPDYRNGTCSLRALNLGQNYIIGEIPRWLGLCSNLSFLDLSSNSLHGPVPLQLGVPCMSYVNVSRNLLSDSFLRFSDTSCSENLISDSIYGDVAEEEHLLNTYFNIFLQSARMGSPTESIIGGNYVVLHDFSRNNFSGPLPLFSFKFGRNFSYGLFLNNNEFNGSLSPEFFTLCKAVSTFAVKLSVNRISGDIGMLTGCSQLTIFEAANNLLSGLIPSDVGNLSALSYLDLRENYLNGAVPDQLGTLKSIQQVLLSGNSLSGEIPVQLGGIAALTVLDLSNNSLTGVIPSTLANATNLEAILLNHNRLSGEIPPSIGMLPKLLKLDVSYNNLSGDIPHFRHLSNCESFRGNNYLRPCLDTSTASFASSSLAEPPSHGPKLTSFMVASISSASVIATVLVLLILTLLCRRKNFVWTPRPRKKVVVTFIDTPAELNYENVVKATGNFSIQNLIGSGGFGATYKAELAPGYLVAVKRLSMGRFQGLKQFDAEIRTLGRIRHNNLVTLVGYHLGETDTFLIYNYLPGGNLEAFIKNLPRGDVHWPVIHKIALDVAEALAYLHYSCVPRIVHRDIKPSNILLDEKLNAYLSDFGLARLLEVSQTHATTDVAGTFGYVAPEYASTCRVSDKADVYSFGVVLLELVSGKRSLDPSFSKYGNGFTIVAWGRLLIQQEQAGEVFPPPLWEAGPQNKLVRMLRLALACTVEDLPVRPSMKQVIETLKQLKD